MSTKSKDLLLNKFSQSEFELNEEQIPYSISVEKLIGEPSEKKTKVTNIKYDSSILKRTIHLLGAGIAHTFIKLKGKLNKIIEEKIETIESRLSNAEINFEEKLSLHSSISSNPTNNRYSSPKIKELVDGFKQNISTIKEGKSAHVNIEIKGDNELICSKYFQKEAEAISLIFLCMKKNKLEQNVVFLDFKINETDQNYKTQIVLELNKESLRWSKIFMSNITCDFIPVLKNDLKDTKFELVSDLHQEKDFFNIYFSHDKANFLTTQKTYRSRFSKENGLGV